MSLTPLLSTTLTLAPCSSSSLITSVCPSTQAIPSGVRYIIIIIDITNYCVSYFLFISVININSILLQQHFNYLCTSFQTGTTKWCILHNNNNNEYYVNTMSPTLSLSVIVTSAPCFSSSSTISVCPS